MPLTARPNQRLGGHDIFTVECQGRRAIQDVAELNGLRYAPAERSIVLAGAAKLGTAGPYVVAPAERVDVLVTDAPEEHCAPFRGLGVEVITA